MVQNQITTVEVATLFYVCFCWDWSLRRPVCYSNQSLFRPNRVYGRKPGDVRTAFCRCHGRELSSVLAVGAIGRKHGRDPLNHYWKFDLPHIWHRRTWCRTPGMEFPPRYCLTVTGVHGWVRPSNSGRHSGGHVSLSADGGAGIVAYRLGAIWRWRSRIHGDGFGSRRHRSPIERGISCLRVIEPVCHYFGADRQKKIVFWSAPNE